MFIQIQIKEFIIIQASSNCIVSKVLPKQVYDEWLAKKK